MIKLSPDMFRLMDDVSIEKAMEAEDNVNDEMGVMMHEMSQTSASRAPVDTGYLREQLTEGVVERGKFHWDFVPDVYGTIPYLFRQNFEHRYKGLFLTSAFNEIEAQFGRRLNEAVDRTW